MWIHIPPNQSRVQGDDKSESKAHPVNDDGIEDSSGYKIAANVATKELLKPTEDQSLNKYVDSLAGKTGSAQLRDAKNPHRVVLESMSIMREGGLTPIVIDLSKLATTKQIPHYVLKQGQQYALQFKYYVQREIVLGLKFHNVVSRLGIKVDKNTIVIGSFAPQTDAYTSTGPSDVVASGFAARGNYSAHAKFVDDDQHVFFEFDSTFEIAKKWADEK